MPRPLLLVVIHLLSAAAHLWLGLWTLVLGAMIGTLTAAVLYGLWTLLGLGWVAWCFAVVAVAFIGRGADACDLFGTAAPKPPSSPADETPRRSPRSMAMAAMRAAAWETVKAQLTGRPVDGRAVASAALSAGVRAARPA